LPISADIKFRKVAQALFEGKSPGDASRAAGYDDTTGCFEANARKRVHHPQVRAYLAQLQRRAAVLAEVDRAYVLLGLKDYAEFKLADYLNLREDGRIEIKLEGVPRDVINRISEVGADRRTGRIIKIKGERIAALTEIARIIGLHKDPLAEAVQGVGERLKEAFERAARAE
jgi:hypothetical protein